MEVFAIIIKTSIGFEGMKFKEEMKRQKELWFWEKSYMGPGVGEHSSKGKLNGCSQL